MSYSLKNLSKSERPREKLEEKGVSELSDVELLSIILRTGVSGKNVKEISSEILEKYSLSSISERPMEDLKEFEGVSKVKAGQLKALSELGRRMKVEKKEKISRLSDVEKMVQDMKFMRSEKIRLFHLSSGNRLLKLEEYEGDIGSANLSTRKVFRTALTEKAAAIIIVHNHPSGSPEPSKNDIEVTEDLVEIGENLGVQVLDHVIVGDKIKSMRRSQTVRFQKTNLRHK